MALPSPLAPNTPTPKPKSDDRSTPNSAPRSNDPSNPNVRPPLPAGKRDERKPMSTDPSGEMDSANGGQKSSTPSKDMNSSNSGRTSPTVPGGSPSTKDSKDDSSCCTSDSCTDASHGHDSTTQKRA